MTRKRGGAKKKGNGKRGKRKTRRRSSLTQIQRRTRRNAQQDALDEASLRVSDALQQQLGVPVNLRRQRANQLERQLARENRLRARRGGPPGDDTSSSQRSDISMDMSQGSQASDVAMDSPPKTPYRRKDLAAAAVASPEVKKMDISPGKGLVPVAAASSDEDDMDISPGKGLVPAAALSSDEDEHAMSISPQGPPRLNRQTTPARPRGQGVTPLDPRNNGISMSVDYKPSRQNIPGWFSQHVSRNYHVPLFGFSSFSHPSNVGMDRKTYQNMMKDLDNLLQLYQGYVSQNSPSAAIPTVVRFMEVYIHAHDGSRRGGCKICGKSDSHRGIRIELTIPSQGDSANSYLSSIGFDLLPSNFFNNAEAISIITRVAAVIPYYIMDLINKNNMGQIIREILYFPNQDGQMIEGDNVVCIPLDYYKGRSAGTDPKTRPFGFHKDTIDNTTFYVNLSFDNLVEMYSASLIQCHTNDVDNEPQRCKRAIRFKLPPLGTIGFSDFLLAHTTPTGLCGTYSDGSRGTKIVCGALGRDREISRSRFSGRGAPWPATIVRGSVGVNIQNVQGILPPAHSNPDGSRREWSVEFDTAVRGRLKRIDGSQIMVNRPNFIRSWFTFFFTNDSSSSSSGAAASSAAKPQNKYQLAIVNHNNSIFGSPNTLDLFHHADSRDGQHSDSLARFMAVSSSLSNSDKRQHPDNPAKFFKILAVNRDIYYVVRPSVSSAFQFIIDYDNNPQTPNVLTGGKKRAKKRKKSKARKTKKRRSQKKRKRKRSRKQKKRKSKRKNI